MSLDTPLYDMFVVCLVREGNRLCLCLLTQELPLTVLTTGVWIWLRKLWKHSFQKPLPKRLMATSTRLPFVITSGVTTGCLVATSMNSMNASSTRCDGMVATPSTIRLPQSKFIKLNLNCLVILQQ